MTQHPKNVLVILPLQPHPEGVGSQKRAAAHVSALVQSARVHLVVLDSETTAGRSADEKLLARCESVSLIQYSRRPRRPLAPVAPFSALAELSDPTIKRRLPPAEDIRRAFHNVAGTHIDTVLCFKMLGATIYDYARTIVPLDVTRAIVDFDDIESQLDARGKTYAHIGIEQSLIERLVDFRQRRAEERCLAVYDAVWVCSVTDQRTLEQRKPRATINVVPNSVPLPDAPPPRRLPADIRLLFVGKISYRPNHDGILWFCREVLPLIRASSSRLISLSIVGFDPPADVKALEAHGDIRVTGAVESVAPYYYDSDIVIAPIRAGGGTRIKILEAMSYRRPVVSTRKGAEGIEASPGDDILIGDTAETFAKCCLSLADDEPLRNRLARRGRELVEQRYSAGIVSNFVNSIV